VCRTKGSRGCTHGALTQPSFDQMCPSRSNDALAVPECPLRFCMHTDHPQSRSNVLQIPSHTKSHGSPTSRPFGAAELVPWQQHGAFITTWFLLAHSGLAWRGSRAWTHLSGAWRFFSNVHNARGKARRWRLHDDDWVLEPAIDWTRWRTLTSVKPATKMSQKVALTKGLPMATCLV
jgi:hypothetical protein